MTLFCSICNNRLKNKFSLSSHVSRYHPKSISCDVGDSTSLPVKKKQLSENQEETQLDANVKACSTKEVKLEVGVLKVDQKDENRLDDKVNDKSFNYVSTCPSVMRGLTSSNIYSTSYIKKAKKRPNSKSTYKRRKYNDVLPSEKGSTTKPYPNQKFQQSVNKPRKEYKQNVSLETNMNKLSENQHVMDLLSSIKHDLQRFVPRATQSFSLLTSFGIRNLLFKAIVTNKEDIQGKLSENQLLLIEAVLSLTSLDEVCRLLNANTDLLLEIVAYISD